MTAVHYPLRIGVHSAPLTSHLGPFWSLGYGMLAASWLLGGAGYPGDSAVDPNARMSLLGIVAPEVGATLLATLSLLGVVVGVAMLRDGGHGIVRRLAIGFGAFTAVTFAVLVPDLRVLIALAYAPIFVVGAPFGFPPGASFTSVITWPLVHQVVAMAGGLIWAAATIGYRRRTAGACERCGRAPKTLDEQEVAWAARWGRRAAVVAVVIPLIYSTTRWAWFLGIPLGVSDATLRWGAGNEWLAGAMLASVAALGALLTTGLILPWGEVMPGWVPIFAKRRIPPALAIVPASAMAIIITSAGLATARLVLFGGMSFPVDDWGAIAPTLLWPIWGPALGLATLAYSYRRRRRCQVCGRGGAASEA